ncbi:MAG: ribosome small subunit-dependent GTPase A [Clostridia bacterium]|nr:ribosome small subunit-dependent GTPase A [Clostridia bacterium]
MKGLIINKNANLFSVEHEKQIHVLSPSGKTRAKGIFVGDYVEFENSITKVCPRKNILIRPPVANIDKMFIIIAPKPKPDFVLVDKILVYCHLNDIQPVIVVNKADICEEGFTREVCDYYKGFYKVLSVSAKEGNLETLKNQIDGICVLAGQSAVGKSSLINAMFGENFADVGELSKKIERGKQTTRIVHLFKVKEGAYIADTAGFSLLDLGFVSTLDAKDLSSYYPDFLKARGECKFRSCTHEGGDCGVIENIKNGQINKNRYANYLKILQELKNAKRY